MKKTIVEAISKLVEAPESLLIILGAVLIALGASGGVTYNNWFPILQPWAQALLAAAGFIFVLVGSFLVRLKPKSARPYGISIAHPKPNTAVDVTDVDGTIRKRPNDYSLWIFRLYDNGRYTPMRKIEPVPGEEKWEVKGIDIGGKPGDHRQLAVYLVGPSGEALIHYHLEAVKSHNDIIDKFDMRIEALNNYYQVALKNHNISVSNFDVQKDQKDRWLPAIGEPMKNLDMIECDRVSVTRKH
jgi:hypothetical protein